VNPPKRYLQPPCESLVRFSGGTYESLREAEPFVLLGVHPYDMVAVNQMDKVFSSDNADVHYMKRREAATIVAVDPQAVGPNCFADCVGASTVDEGPDVLLTKVGDDYVADVATPKGEALFAGVDVPDAAASTANEAAAARAEGAKKLRKHELNFKPHELAGILEEEYDNPVWEEKARLCFSCGSCNLICPTCYCFDVKENPGWDGKSSVRERTWDGCMLAGFALVAGGHNFRGDKTDRFRHRYYRKAKYIPERYGDFACVGCGRCISACVSKIANPPEIFNRVYESSQSK